MATSWLVSSLCHTYWLCSCWPEWKLASQKWGCDDFSTTFFFSCPLISFNIKMQANCSGNYLKKRSLLAKLLMPLKSEVGKLKWIQFAVEPVRLFLPQAFYFQTTIGKSCHKLESFRFNCQEGIKVIIVLRSRTRAVPWLSSLLGLICSRMPVF